MNEQAFVDSINASPKDRTPQLVFADWLDEQGDPRGEAWRVLVQIRKMPAQWAVSWRWQRNWLTAPYMLPSSLFARLDYLPGMWGPDMACYSSFFAAFNDAVIAYVRYYHDPLFAIPPEKRGRWTKFGIENEQELARRRAAQNEGDLIPVDPIPQLPLSLGPHAP